jgi:hypothetical protein
MRCDRPLVTLRVLTQFRDYVAMQFVIDTGAEFSCIPVRTAQEYHISFDRDRPGVAGGLLGRTVRYRGGFLVRIGRETHNWPCNFLQSQAGAGEEALPVLGRAGFRDAYDFCLDDEFLTLTRRTRLRRWWRAFGRWVAHPFVTIRTAEEAV